MKSLWFLLYNILILPELYLLSSIATLFNDKVRRGFGERKKQNKTLDRKFEKLDRDKKLIWFHSASLGEI